MVRVTIEIVPFGDEERKRTVINMNISNITPWKWDIGDYKITVEDVEFNIKRFDRSLGVEALVTKALRKYRRIKNEK